MSGLPNVSLNDFYALVEANPVHRNMVRQRYVKTYDEFIDVFYEMLDYCIGRLEENPQHHQEDTEDQLTHQLVNLLQVAGYNVTQGETGGGNKDITVRWLNPDWSWIGESKKYHSLTDVREGFLQLTTRYRNSNPLYTQGGLIAFTLRPKAAALIKEWMDEAATMKLDNFRAEDCPRRPKLAYISYHDHVASGLPCKIRHIAVVLYFHPEDKSGRTAKKYQNAEAVTPAEPTGLAKPVAEQDTGTKAA